MPQNQSGSAISRVVANGRFGSKKGGSAGSAAIGLADRPPRRASRHHAASRILRISSSTRRKSCPGATHMVRYVSRTPSHEILPYLSISCGHAPVLDSNPVLAETSANSP
jgi:hypothetical protein